MATMTIVCCLIAFVTGGIPFGYLIGRLVLKDDIRKHGSGNIGATNVGRVMGWKWGSLVLILDAIKGLAPTLGANLFLSTRPNFDATQTAGLQTAVILTGISTIIGHMFPIWLRFKGGKGVATALGVVLVISPQASLIALVLFILTALATRIVALASILASLGFAVTQLTLLGRSAFDLPRLPLTLFSTLVPALIIWRHRSNIQRMWKGQENRFSTRSRTSTTTVTNQDDQSTHSG